MCCLFVCCCRYCQEFYQEEKNHRGSCKHAPDCVKKSIDHMTGIGCARCMLYHCMGDSEGDIINHPCSCHSDNGCAKRWTALTLLSLIVPCLWCYPPLRACHLLCVQCGICGAKHKPQIWQPIKINHFQPQQQHLPVYQQQPLPNLYNHRALFTNFHYVSSKQWIFAGKCLKSHILSTLIFQI